jgi:hypothetical protein
MDRKTFLGRLLAGTGAVLAATAGGWWIWRNYKSASKEIPAKIMGASHSRGHRLRSQQKPFMADETRRIDVLIVGAGVAGLNAARTLEKSGIHDFWVVDLEDQIGGNASSGRNDVSAYPWGAHYLPVPDVRNHDLMEFLSSVGVVKGMVNGLPWYEEAYLCHAPQERLYIHGTWQEGLIPRLGVPEVERKQIEAFQQEMTRYKNWNGTDGRPAFSIPVQESSLDATLRELDSITMEQWLHAKGWDSPYLHEYVNYCCRDDFGLTHRQCSAWAGIHYFAARGGEAANATESDVLTWPEGNAWLAGQLASPILGRIGTGYMVLAVRNVDQGIEAEVLRVQDGKQIRVEAKAAICAIPRFVAERIVEGLPVLSGFSYAPWVVANITLDQRPQGMGAPLSWDNVEHGGASLGYIVADHQKLSGHPDAETVITWYMPLSNQEPSVARSEALDRPATFWRDLALDELERLHPGLKSYTRQVDVWVWGHGMIRPVPGFISGVEREKARLNHGRVSFAHSDLSGISIFEEAFYWGNRAALAVKKLLS